MDICILRHGKAEQGGPGMDDADRRLTGKGRTEIAIAGRYLASQEIPLDLIATSPLARARETAGIVAGKLGQKTPPITWKVLAPGGRPDDVCRELDRHQDCRAILIVGHEPLLSALISRIICGQENAAIGLSKGGLALVRGFTSSQMPAGELRWLLTARQIADLSSGS